MWILPEQIVFCFYLTNIASIEETVLVVVILILFISFRHDENESSGVKFC